MHACFAAALLCDSASAQSYGGGIGKTTHAISGGSTTNAPAALEWFTTRIPATGPASFGKACIDSTYCPCGQVGRVNVEDGSSGGSGGSQGFGLHTVHVNGSSPRPVGDVGVDVLEGHMTSKFKAVAGTSAYDAFLDFNTGFWVSDLDPYVKAFADLPSLAIEWTDSNNGKTYYSLMVQVLESYVVLEFMSATQTQLPSSRYSSPHPRFYFKEGETPESVIGSLSGTGTDVNLPLLHAVRVSHYTTDVARDRSYYADILGANVITTLEDGVQTLVVDFSNMAKSPNYAQLHLVQRSSSDTNGGFKVADAEETMNKEHRVALTSDVCGWDQWMDFHTAVNTGGSRTFGDLVPKMEAAGHKYHVLAGAMRGGNTLYAVTPNGISIQMTGMSDGTFTPSDTPTGVDGLCGAGPASCSKSSIFA